MSQQAFRELVEDSKLKSLAIGQAQIYIAYVAEEVVRRIIITTTTSLVKYDKIKRIYEKDLTKERKEILKKIEDGVLLDIYEPDGRIHKKDTITDKDMQWSVSSDTELHYLFHTVGTRYNAPKVKQRDINKIMKKRLLDNKLEAKLKVSEEGVYYLSAIVDKLIRLIIGKLPDQKNDLKTTKKVIKEIMGCSPEILQIVEKKDQDS